MDDMSSSMSTLSTKVLYCLLPYCLKSTKEECSIHCVKKKTKGCPRGSTMYQVTISGIQKLTLGQALDVRQVVLPTASLSL